MFDRYGGNLAREQFFERFFAIGGALVIVAVGAGVYATHPRFAAPPPVEPQLTRTGITGWPQFGDWPPGQPPGPGCVWTRADLPDGAGRWSCFASLGGATAELAFIVAPGGRHEQLIIRANGTQCPPLFGWVRQGLGEGVATTKRRGGPERDNWQWDTALWIAGGLGPVPTEECAALVMERR